MQQPRFQPLLWNLSADDLRTLLDGGLRVDQPDESGDYPLTVACHRLQVDSVQLLLAAGADPNVQNFEQDTPMLCAIDCVHHNPAKAIEVVDLLMSAGADIEKRGYMDKTPYLKACSRGDLDMVKKLVALGADTKAYVIDGGRMTGLDFANIFDASIEMKAFIMQVQ